MELRFAQVRFSEHLARLSYFGLRLPAE